MHSGGRVVWKRSGREPRPNDLDGVLTPVDRELLPRDMARGSGNEKRGGSCLILGLGKAPEWYPEPPLLRVAVDDTLDVAGSLRAHQHLGLRRAG